MTGKSTFVVSLPKKWVGKVNIHTGDSVAMLPLPDGTLLVNPHISRKDKDSRKRVVSLDSDNPEQTHREFIGAYLSGYNVFEFRSRTLIDKDTRQLVRRIGESVIGPQIVDETPNSIVMRNLLDASDFSLSKAVKRMHIVARDMQLEALALVQKRSDEIAEDLVRRDDDVDRLARMITKQYNLILRDVSFSEKMAVRPQEALGYLMISRTLERIADHAVRIAGNSKELTGPPEITKLTYDTGHAVVALLDDAMNSFYRSRLDQAFEAAEKGKSLESATSRLTHDVLSWNGTAPTSVPLALVADSIERTRAYAVDISETAINHIFAMEFDAELEKQEMEKLARKRSAEHTASQHPTMASETPVLAAEKPGSGFH